MFWLRPLAPGGPARGLAPRSRLLSEQAPSLSLSLLSPPPPHAKRRSPELGGVQTASLAPKRRALRTAPLAAAAAAGGGGGGGGGSPPPPPPRRPTGGGGDDEGRSPPPPRDSLALGTAAAFAFAALAGWAAWDTLPTAGVDESALSAGLTVVIPCLNESAAIERTLALVAGSGGGGAAAATSSPAALFLSPPPLEVIVVDGGSTDGTADLAERFARRHNREVEEHEEEERRRRSRRQRRGKRRGGGGGGGQQDEEEEGQSPPPSPPPLPIPPRVRVVRLNRRGRAVQMNAGAALARGELLAFLHADTQPPADLVSAARGWFRDRRNVALGFVPSIEVDRDAWLAARRRWKSGGRGEGGEEEEEATRGGKERSGSGSGGSNGSSNGAPDPRPGRPQHVLLAQSAHNTIKTLFYPALLRPTAFLRGLRLLFGDQVLVVRAADLRRAGGYDERYAIMEDADLCLRLHKQGPYRDGGIGIVGIGGGVGGLGGGAGKKTRPALLTKQQQEAAAREDLRGWSRQPTEAAFAAAPWSRARGRVRMDCRRVARTSGRRLAAWGFLRGSVTNFRIASAWYFLHSPERVRDLYARLYTDAYR